MTKIREERFEKVVLSKDGCSTFEDIFWGTFLGLIVWITCFIWVPIWWYTVQLPKIVKYNRIVYWRKIKD